MLYRELGCYLVRVFDAPVLERSSRGQSYLSFGGYDSGDAAFRPEELSGAGEPPVWETVGIGGFRKTADSFAEWLQRRAKSARKRYSAREWAAIIAGPPPFTEEELSIIRARNQFKWRLIEVTSKGVLRFEVTNNSDRRLPYLSIGVRAPNLLGGIALPISNIVPGKTAVVEHRGYGVIVDPREVEVFADPDPQPEDREYYWEFGKPK